MPKNPNTVHWKDIHSVAIKLDFFYKRTEGDHRQYFKTDHGGLTIPMYKEINTSGGHIFPSILHQLGITKRKFFEILNGQ